MEQINVLIVDDSLVIRGILTKILEGDPGIRVIDAVASTAEADVTIANHIVDVVTLDIDMPGCNGLDYLPSLTRRHIPVVMLSGRTTDGAPESAQAMERGAFACFDKSKAASGATALVRCVKKAALLKGTPATLAFVHTTGEDAITATLNRLVARHGKDVSRFIAEKIGYAVLAQDQGTVDNWVTISRRLDDLLSQSIGAPLPMSNVL